MSRIVGSQTEAAIRDFRVKFVPCCRRRRRSCWCCCRSSPTSPLLPDFGFLMLITWRLLRPEIWTPRMALGLGLFADLVAGHPLGQSMLLWTTAFLVFDLIDARLGFRDYWMDWLIAGGGPGPPYASARGILRC